MKIIFLHGVGQDSRAWDGVRAALSAYDCLSLNLLHDGDLPVFSILQEQVRQAIREADDEVALVGLSLGGMLALSMLEKPEPNLVGVVSIAGQYKFVGNWAYKFQVGLIKLLPSAVFAKQGLKKSNLVAFYKNLEELDMTEFLEMSQVPILLICGSKDRMNLKTADELKRILTQVELRIIDGAGHEVNKDQPQLLASQIDRFVRKILQSE